MALSFGVEAFEWDKDMCQAPNEEIFTRAVGGYNEYRIVSLVPYCDSRYADAFAQKEYIDDYLMALQSLAGQDMTNIQFRDHNDVKSFPASRLTIPCVYLSCHVMELAIKQTLHNCFGVGEWGHDLKVLWKSLCCYLYDRNYVVADVGFLDRMNNFVLFMYSLIDAQNTKYRYAYGKNGALSQSIPEYINPVYMVRYVEEFVGCLGVLGEEKLHPPVEENKVCISKDSMSTSSWSFGCSNIRLNQGLHLCCVILNASYLQGRGFGLVGNMTTHKDAYHVARTFDALLKVVNDLKCGEVEWRYDCTYRGFPVLFSGRQHSLRISVNYQDLKDSDICDLMNAIWDELKTVKMEGLT